MTDHTPEKGLGLESRMERLDTIAQQLESGDLELDEALRLFEEAVAHLRLAHDQLREAELRVEEMVGRAEDGRVRPLDADGE